MELDCLSYAGNHVDRWSLVVEWFVSQHDQNRLGGCLAWLAGLAGREVQHKIIKIPARLKRMAEYIESRAAPRSFTFEFLYNRAIAL